MTRPVSFTLLASACALLTTGCIFGGGKRQASITPTNDPPVAFADGCYVRLFEDTGMDASDDTDTVIGPGKFATLEMLPNAREKYNWKNDFESLIVGPNAMVTLWEGENFGGKMVQFGPGATVPDLGAYNIADDAESMEITRVETP